jgi:hypothetical protein
MNYDLSVIRSAIEKLVNNQEVPKEILDKFLEINLIELREGKYYISEKFSWVTLEFNSLYKVTKSTVFNQLYDKSLYISRKKMESYKAMTRFIKTSSKVFSADVKVKREKGLASSEISFIKDAKGSGVIFNLTFSPPLEFNEVVERYYYLTLPLESITVEEGSENIAYIAHFFAQPIVNCSIILEVDKDIEVMEDFYTSTATAYDFNDVRKNLIKTNVKFRVEDRGKYNFAKVSFKPKLFKLYVNKLKVKM